MNSRSVPAVLRLALCVLASMLPSFPLGALPPAPVSAAATASPAAPDLEIVALQTTGPGRIGDCNAVVARLRNSGTAATVEAPAVRLDVDGGARWTRTARAGAPLTPGDTVEIWFEDVPLEGGRLSQLEATADPGGRELESDETNNARRVPRDPQLACGAPDHIAERGPDLRVLVLGRSGTEVAQAPIAGAVVTVTSPLGVGRVLASGMTDGEGRALLTFAEDSRSPVLRVSASAPDCPQEVRIATLSPGSAAPLELAIELHCTADATAPTAAESGVLEVETALPGRLRVDDGPAESVTFGSRVTVRRPGRSVRLEASSANGTVFYDATVEVPPGERGTVVVDAPPLHSSPGDWPIVEDLRSGLRWTIGALTCASFDQAATLCDGLERGAATDWRLPEIDELVFVLEESARAFGGTDAPLHDLAGSSLWSTTEHAGLRLAYYLDGGHIYGRRADEGDLGALCVTGTAYDVDPLLVPDRYHDRLPGLRRFRPRDQ